MKLHMITLFIALLILGAASIHAQDEVSKKSEWAVEIDPATYVFNGFSAHIRYSPKGAERMVIGVGTYAMNFPAPLINMNSSNRDLGWNVRLSRGVGLFGEYYFKEANRGVYFGLQVATQQYRISLKESSTAQFQNILVMPSIGTNIALFSSKFYLKPWIGLGYTSQINGSNVIENNEYDIAPLLPFATLHLGYKF